MKLCITKPQYIYAHWKARRAFADYPLYDVPNKKPERRLGEKKIQENFDYFMRVKDERLAYMIDWLQREFSVTVSLTPEGAYALDRWIKKYAGGLMIASKGDLISDLDFVFENYNFDWRDNYNICNLIIDLGIFIGEYCIKKYPFLAWAIYRGHAIEKSSFGAACYKRPALHFFPGGQTPDCMQSAEMCLHTSHLKTHIFLPKSLFFSNSNLIAVLQQLLALARREPGLPWEDTSHEPI